MPELNPGGPREAPTNLRGMVRYLGPGMIVAAGVVGSGELIATTKAGAQAGISLLWIILLGCVIKVFTQIELGRYAVSTNETTLTAINRIPGPRLARQLDHLAMADHDGDDLRNDGGIVGAVGQALAMTIPITGDYALAIKSAMAIEPQSTDVRIWATAVAIGTSVLLFFGRYRLLQTLCVALAFCFTLITIGNVVALQTSDYAIPVNQILDGLWFGWPDNPAAWMTALAAFGIIGIGGTDLIVYPYWCLERGYGRFIGARSDDPGWAGRALGWVRVMKVDAFVSMCIYTIATLAFYFIGAAVLHRNGLDPDGMRMVSTLATAYVPVFGEYAKALFLAGALTVLYSTFLVANAGAARLLTDCGGILACSAIRSRRETARLQACPWRCRCWLC